MLIHHSFWIKQNWTWRGATNLKHVILCYKWKLHNMNFRLPERKFYLLCCKLKSTPVMPVTSSASLMFISYIRLQEGSYFYVTSCLLILTPVNYWHIRNGHQDNRGQKAERNSCSHTKKFLLMHNWTGHVSDTMETSCFTLCLSKWQPSTLLQQPCCYSSLDSSFNFTSWVKLLKIITHVVKTHKKLCGKHQMFLLKYKHKYQTQTPPHT